MVITCKICYKLFDLEVFGYTISRPLLFTNITSNIQLFNDCNICIGGPLNNQYLLVQNNNIASIGLNGRLQHFRCPFVMDNKGLQVQS